MSLKALITTIAILGSSSLALAAPGSYGPEVRDHRTEVTDHRASIDATAQADIRSAPPARPLPVRPMPPVYAPVTLASNTQLHGRASIEVAPTAQRFTKLELRAEQGRTSINKVIVVYGNGRAQTFELDAKLSKKQPSVSIDLRGRNRSIERIVLVGRSNGRNASLDVIAA